MLATMWTIALHEAQDQLASRRMGLAGLFCALLTVASLSLLLGDYTVRKHGYDQRDQAGQTRAGKRPKLSAPPTPLSVLARGLEMHNGRLLFITWSQPRRQPGAAVMDQGDPNPLFEIFQAPDLVHIVQYILSLLALLAAYDAICGERMRGTLALVFTGPLRRGVFIAGKALGYYWALAIWIVSSFAPYVAAGLLEGQPARMVEANISRTRFAAEREGWAEVARFIRDRGWGEREEAKQIEAESFPYFTYRPEVEKAGAEVLVYPLILFLYAIGFFLAAYLRFARAEI